MWLAFIDIEHPIQVFNLINGILWLDGIKYRIVFGFNKKIRVKYWNGYRTLVEDVDNENDTLEEATNVEDSLFDPMKSEQFIEVLVCRDKLQKHANYHEVDNIELAVMEMKENIDFVMAKDPKLEPSTVYIAVLLDSRVLW